jgi:hypothetical protein
MHHQDYVLERPSSTDRTSFLEHFWHHQWILRNPDVVELIVAFEACEDARGYNRECTHPNAKAMVRFTLPSSAGSIVPKLYPLTSLWCGVIGIIDWTQSFEDSAAVMDSSISNRETFVNVDLANDEIKYDSGPFESLFRKA